MEPRVKILFVLQEREFLDLIAKDQKETSSFTTL
jgi:hypothetical protein